MDQGTLLSDAQERLRRVTHQMEEARAAADAAKRHSNATEQKYIEVYFEVYCIA